MIKKHSNSFKYGIIYMFTTLFLSLLFTIPTTVNAVVENSISENTTDIVLTSDKTQYNVGEIVTATIESKEAADIFGVQFTLKYDPSVFQLQGEGVDLQGNYQTFGGTTVDTTNGKLTYPVINLTKDETNIIQKIGIIKLKVLKDGNTSLSLSKVKAVDNTAINTISRNTDYSIPIICGVTTSSNPGTSGNQGIPSNSVSPSNSTTPVSPLTTNVSRLFGTNRIETSITIAKELYNDKKPDAVVLATANDFADALAGSGLAYKYS